MLFCESEAEPAARSRAMTARMPEHTGAMATSLHWLPPEGYLQDGKLAPGDPLDNQHPVAPLHDPLARLRNCGRRRAAVVTSNSGDRTPPRRRSITHCADRLHCLRPPQLIPPPESFDSPLDGHRFANSGEGRMAVRADLHSEIVLGGAGGNFVPASAAHERIHVWRMDSLLHLTPSSCEMPSTPT